MSYWRYRAAFAFRDFLAGREEPLPEWGAIDVLFDAADRHFTFAALFHGPPPNDIRWRISEAELFQQGEVAQRHFAYRDLYEAVRAEYRHTRQLVRESEVRGVFNGVTFREVAEITTAQMPPPNPPDTLTVETCRRAVEMMRQVEQQRRQAPRPERCHCPACRHQRREMSDRYVDQLREQDRRAREQFRAELHDIAAQRLVERVPLGWVQPSPAQPSPAAIEKSLALLKSWLSPDQLTQYESGAFEVKGSAGGRYRIRADSTYNVDELDRGGQPTGVRYCFQPEGAPALGDIMLAQKIALETDEEGALKVANQSGFPMSMTMAQAMQAMRDEQRGLRERRAMQAMWRMPDSF